MSIHNKGITYQLGTLFKFCKGFLIAECHNFLFTGYHLLQGLGHLHSALPGSTAQPGGQDAHINLARQGISSRLLQGFAMKSVQVKSKGKVHPRTRQEGPEGE